MKISLFIPCYVDTLFPETGIAMVQLFERLGHEVTFPQKQTCCGQMHFNTGYQAEARALLAHFLDAFEGCETIVAPSASCVGMVREFYPYLAEQAGQDDLAARLAPLTQNVYELSEFLTQVLKVEDVGAYFPHRVTYHPTCHSLRGIQVGDAPLNLLKAVRGLLLLPLPDASSCCGFGGTFALKNAAVSSAMLSDKLANIQQTHAEYCVAVDDSCLMHIGGGLSRVRAATKVIHLASILASAEA